MGSVSTHYGTELSLALDELGVTGGYNSVVKKAAGGTDIEGRKMTWFILQSEREHDKGTRYIALALTSRSPSYGVWCKVIEEHMGPCEVNVPDKIWANRPPCPNSEFAQNWREAVKQAKAEWPFSLDEVPTGVTVQITWYKGTWTREPGDYKGQPVFSGNGYSRTRLAKWKSLRAKPV